MSETNIAAPHEGFWATSDTIRQVIGKLNAKKERKHDLSGVHYPPDQDCRMAVWVLEALASERDALKARAEAAEAEVARLREKMDTEKDDE